MSKDEPPEDPPEKARFLILGWTEAESLIFDLLILGIDFEAAEAKAAAVPSIVDQDIF